MNKPKRKNSSLLREHAISFSLLWALYTMTASFISYILFSQGGVVVSQQYPHLIPRYPVILIFLLMAVPALLQVVLGERYLKRSMRRWFLYNLIGAGLTVFLLLTLNPGTYWSYVNILYDAPIYFLVGTILQTIWLGRHVRASFRLPKIAARLLGIVPNPMLRVKMAWIWPILGILGLIGSWTQPFSHRLMPGGEGSFVLWLAVYSFVQGLTMHYLLTHPHNTEKAKLHFDTDKDDERLDRLQDHERSTPLWDRGDEQALHSEA